MIARAALLFLATFAIATPAAASVFLRVMDPDNADVLAQLELCDESVFEAYSSIDEVTGEPALFVTLSGEGSEKLAAMTTQSVGQTMQIVIGSTVVSEPMILEPILGGQIQINGPSDEDFARIEAAVGAPCTIQETIA